MSANESGKRLAAAHLIFNVVTGIIAIAFIYQLVDLVEGISAAWDRGRRLHPQTGRVPLGVQPARYRRDAAAAESHGVNLEKFIPEKKPEVDQPKYLSGSSAEFPGTAVEAVRMETLRVYEAALRIIVDALGMKKADVLSTVDLEQTVAAQNRFICLTSMRCTKDTSRVSTALS